MPLTTCHPFRPVVLSAQHTTSYTYHITHHTHLPRPTLGTVSNDFPPILFLSVSVDEDRLEKERAAVLSEASMVNKMEYRVECQVLSALHSENRISTRFPIGKESLIKIWRKEDVQLYHNTHYRPDNVILYIVGDLDTASTVESIKQKFGHLSPKIDAAKLLKESGEFPESSMRKVSRHFPPVVHRWSCPESKVSTFVSPELALTLAPPLSREQKMAGGMLPKPRIFKHELLQSFSFHLFAKRPIEPVVTRFALRRDIMRRMALSALQIRFNVNQRQDPLFTFVDFNQLNWPREGKRATLSVLIVAEISSCCTIYPYLLVPDMPRYIKSINRNYHTLINYHLLIGNRSLSFFHMYEILSSFLDVISRLP